MATAAYVDQRLHLSLEAFTPEQLDRVRELFVHDNPEYQTWVKYRSRGRRSSFQRPPNRTVGTWKQSGGYLHVPRGRQDEVFDALGVPMDERSSMVDDRRVAGTHHAHRLSGIEPRDYQLRLGDELALRQTCLWRSPTASGKTTAVFFAISRLQTWTLVVVPNTALHDQWVKRVTEAFGKRPAVIKGGRREIGPITVAMQASLLSCLDQVAQHFGFIVCDEVQLFAAKTFNAVIEASPAKYRLGVSNDEHRADGKEYLIHDQFGEPPPGAIIRREELLAAGNIVDVGVRLVPSDFTLPWYEQLSPEKKFQKRSEFVEALVNDEDRNALVVSCATWCLEEGEQVAVLSARRDHCERLDALLSVHAGEVGRLMGAQEAGDKQNFVESVRRFASGELRAVVGTFQAIGVGFESHTRLARGVFATPVATLESAKPQLMQYLGRFARASAGKTDAWVYLVFDPHVHGDRPVRLLRKWVNQCEVYDRQSASWVPSGVWLKKGNSSEKAQRREKPSDDGNDDLFVSAQRRRRG